MKKLLLFALFGLLFACKESPGQHSAEAVFAPYKSLENTEYGFLEVPENRDVKASRTIKLAYLVLKARNPNSGKEPILYLQGGPGGSTLFMANFWNDHELRSDRDIVLMDQRGTGASNAICTDLGDQLISILSKDLSAAGEHQELSKVIESCKENAEASGTDLSGYNSRENAADFEQLRQELGVTKWNVMGGSYGSRLGLTIMRDYPESVRSAILFSIFAPENDLYVNFISNFKQSLFRAFEKCGQEADCNARYPNLKERYFELLQKLETAPLSFEFRGESFVLNPQDVLLLTHQLLYQKNRIGFVPSFIEAMETGNEEVLNRALAPTVATSSLINIAMYLSVMTYEELPFNNSDAYAKDLQANPEFNTGPAFFNSDTRLMENWHSSRATAREDDAVVSDIPTLVMNGYLDPITPSSNARQMIESLENSYFFEFQNEGHSFFNPCFFQICRSFLDQPESQPQASCVEENPQIPWN